MQGKIDFFFKKGKQMFLVTESFVLLEKEIFFFFFDVHKPY